MRQSWPEPAVELRLGKIRARLAQDLVGLPKLAVLAFQSLQLCRHIRGNTGAHTTVALGLLHPLMQRLRRAADLGGDRRDRHPARGMLAFVIQNHSHRAGADLGRELVGSSCLSWLHILRSWSLRSTRSGSRTFLGRALDWAAL